LRASAEHDGRFLFCNSVLTVTALTQVTGSDCSDGSVGGHYNPTIQPTMGELSLNLGVSSRDPVLVQTCLWHYTYLVPHFLYLYGVGLNKSLCESYLIRCCLRQDLPNPMVWRQHVVDGITLWGPDSIVGRSATNCKEMYCRIQAIPSTSYTYYRTIG
jgi:hypothetical protein